jgi:hypothetical protein
MRRTPGFSLLLLLASLACGVATVPGLPAPDRANAGYDALGDAGGLAAEQRPGTLHDALQGGPGQGLIALSSSAPSAPSASEEGSLVSARWSRRGVSPPAWTLHLRPPPSETEIFRGPPLPPFTTTLPPPADVRS